MIVTKACLENRNVLKCRCGQEIEEFNTTFVWDRDTDTVYVVRSYRHREGSPVIHAAALRPWGKIPWAWPRDGRRETLEGAGIALAEQYRAQGLNMLYEHAQFVDRSVSVQNGDLVLACWGGEAPVCKILHGLPDRLELHSANPDFPALRPPACAASAPNGRRATWRRR